MRSLLRSFGPIALAGILSLAATPHAQAAKKANPKFANLLLAKQLQGQSALAAREVRQAKQAVNRLLKREAHLGTASAGMKVPQAVLLGRNRTLRNAVARQLALLDRQILQLQAFINATNNPLFRGRLLRQLTLLAALDERLEVAFGLQEPIPPSQETTPSSPVNGINPFGF